MTQNKTLTDNEAFDLAKAITSFEVWTENRCKTHAELNEYRTHLCKEVWVAAKQESEKEIERLDELNKTQAIYIDDYIVKQVELQSQVNMLRDLLTEARDDVAAQLHEYENLLPFKRHRYDAQKITLDSIDEALSATTSKSLKPHN